MIQTIIHDSKMSTQDWEISFLSNSQWRFSCSGVEEFSWYCWSWCEVPYIIVFWSGESCRNNNSSFPPFFLGVALYLEIAQSWDFDAPSHIKVINIGLCCWPSVPTTYFLVLILSLSFPGKKCRLFVPILWRGSS